MKAEYGYAITSSGRYYPRYIKIQTISWSRKDCVDMFLKKIGESNWKALYKIGFRCVKVKIEVVK